MLRLKEAAPVSRELNIGQIDTAELLLHHVYAFGAAEGNAPGESVAQDPAGWERAEMALLQAEIDTQRQILKLLRNELSDMKKERDAWRSRAHRLCRSASTDLTAAPRPGSFAASLQQRRIHFRRH
ncbi:hypothetical protein JQ582_37325 [Bradyrhizobium japonicum]|jgi:hypothetical protein|uniref:hypothetical protein n=1 Tax=Bradyrhizobium TaxID=374 RepID=UPI0004569CF0|nr:hypothetical protein [Bradyrhizobium japonicum]AHY49338.1 hypothetical protein BJS_08900 [Bradyrhizobium japonicum SEMIA 5079]MBR0734864.1 hypothetical protein [Bradyrhizobium japonicum]MBR0749598.1 hypothetical protein [Bradyrhizobium japonicum]MCD9112230.1 hypothetical protein [Bradyrhizobium japonicum]MCD9258277.1 hypothetical protein [Bradyrhizobium japonicum SEMIA 5079]